MGSLFSKWNAELQHRNQQCNNSSLVLVDWIMKIDILYSYYFCDASYIVSVTNVAVLPLFYKTLYIIIYNIC